MNATPPKDYKNMTVSAYDAAAKTYKEENFNPEFWFSEFKILLDLMREKGAKVKGSKILDLGCGIGRDALLARKVGMEYMGVDLSDGMLSIARNIVKEANFRKMDAAKLDFEDNEFDVIWASAILLHLDSEDLDKTLNEIKRVLKPGKFIFITLEKRKKGRKRKKIKISKKGNKKVKRFFSLYTKQEFEEILDEKEFEILKFTAKIEPDGNKEWLCFFAKN